MTASFVHINSFINKDNIDIEMSVALFMLSTFLCTSSVNKENVINHNKVFWVDMVLNKTACACFTPPRNHGGVIISLQFVSVCVCVSVCLSASEQNYSQTDAPTWTQFLLLVAYRTGSNLIEIGDLGSMVKVTVT